MANEEKLTNKALRRKKREEDVQKRHEQMKEFTSGLRFASPKNEQDNVLSKSSDAIDNWYDKNFGNLFSIFSASHYEFPEIPEDRIKTTIEHPDGFVEPVDIEPEVVRPWICNYYYLPWYKARLVIAIFVIIGMIFVTMSSLTISNTWHTYAAILLLIILLVGTAMRYFGLALYKYPVPKIPWVSDLRAYRTIPEEEEDTDYEAEDESYDDIVEKNADATPVVTPVNRINNGKPSPATLLTRWMNSSSRISEAELIERSGGALDAFKVKLLMQDDEDIWLDYDTVDTLSKITNSKPKQWRDAWYDWNSEQE